MKTIHKTNDSPRFGNCESCGDKRVIHACTVYEMRAEICKSCFIAFEEIEKNAKRPMAVDRHFFTSGRESAISLLKSHMATIPHHRCTDACGVQTSYHKHLDYVSPLPRLHGARLYLIAATV